MTTIVTRYGKGAPLSWAEMDANLTNLNNDKLETSTAATTYTTKVDPATSGTLTHSGDIVLSGTGKRITGDFSNATVANRVMFQTSTADGPTVIAALPNGSSQFSGYHSYNSSDVANASYLGLFQNSSAAYLDAGKFGTGSYLPLTFWTGGSERYRYGIAGELGIAGSNYGTSGQVLTSGGTGTAPSWTTLPGIKQVQSISASVGASALTISASALTLDFRSTTLGSGTVTVVSGTPANLVISSGSTLGTVSAVSSRIAVIALNNAGTIELAAVNLAGGVNLDETGVISTTAEGGAGTADSASVIYSTTARTNLAYRVIGYIQSTQPTAGAWTDLTTNCTIQGIGGLSMVALGSPGFGQTYQTVTRTAGVTYYNTTGKLIRWVINMGVSTNVQVTIGGYTHVAAVTLPSMQGPITYSVPAGASYSYTIAAGTVSHSELR